MSYGYLYLIQHNTLKYLYSLVNGPIYNQLEGLREYSNFVHIRVLMCTYITYVKQFSILDTMLTY